MNMAEKTSTAESEEISVTQGEEQTQTNVRSNKFPMTRIKTIMKTDPDVTLASQEAVFLVSKATEYFLETLTKSAYNFTERGKKKTIKKQDVDLSIDANDAYAFLEGAIEWT